ncbi:MAG: hypothetical protein ACYDAY_12160 [Candidatus Dormibacteria bacterium]
MPYRGIAGRNPVYPDRGGEESAYAAGEDAGFETLLAGEAFIRDNVDCLNYLVKEACFEHFSIFIPAGEPTKL